VCHAGISLPSGKISGARKNASARDAHFDLVRQGLSEIRPEKHGKDQGRAGKISFVYGSARCLLYRGRSNRRWDEAGRHRRRAPPRGAKSSVFVFLDQAAEERSIDMCGSVAEVCARLIKL
jgi:hypothetical protein